MSRILAFIFFALCWHSGIRAQTYDSTLVQLSGLIIDDSGRELASIPYANVYVRNENRGTFTDFSGFFSIVVRHHDTVEFSAIGYQPAIFVVPDTMTQQRYSFVQTLTQDTLNLPTAVVFPWPSREHFKLEFLAMDVSNDLELTAQANMAEEQLAAARRELLPDGKESAGFYMRQQARRSYYLGQAPPMNIYSPLAWAEFFKAWKNGEFRREN